MSDKQQTALQQLIDWNNSKDRYSMITWIELDAKLKELLPIEKQQTDDSYTQGMYKGQSIYFSDDKIKLDVNHLDYCLNESEKYFNETFKTESNGTT